MAVAHRRYPSISDFSPEIRQIMSYRLIVPITNAQALALFTTQIVTVPSLGAGVTIVFDEVKIQYVPGPGPVAFTINGGGKFSVNYTNLAGVQVGQVATVGFIDGTVAKTAWGLNLNVANGHIPTDGAPLVFGVTAANLTLGDGSFVVDTRFRDEPTVVR